MVGIPSESPGVTQVEADRLSKLDTYRSIVVVTFLLPPVNLTPIHLTDCGGLLPTCVIGTFPFYIVKWEWLPPIITNHHKANIGYKKQMFQGSILHTIMLCTKIHFSSLAWKVLCFISTYLGAPFFCWGLPMYMTQIMMQFMGITRTFIFFKHFQFTQNTSTKQRKTFTNLD